MKSDYISIIPQHQLLKHFLLDGESQFRRLLMNSDPHIKRYLYAYQSAAAHVRNNTDQITNHDNKEPNQLQFHKYSYK